MSHQRITRIDATYGRGSRDVRVEALRPTTVGARAALESFYHGFNQRSIEVLEAVWAPDELISLANPLGGIFVGARDIHRLYQRILNGSARVWVEFHDIVEYATRRSVVFAGRERGEFLRGDVSVPLAIRTSRVMQYFGPDLGWRQVHHHGSIESPGALDRYQEAVLG